MRHATYLKKLNEISPGRDIGYITDYKAKRGCKRELDSAKELQAALRDYTYHLIGLGNVFHDIARLYGKFHGSMWRNYRGVCGAELKALADQLSSTCPYDTDAILKIERAVEEYALKLTKQTEEAGRE